MVYSDNAQRGPYSVAQLEGMLRNGEVAQNAVVWTEGMRDWAPISTVVNAVPTPAPMPPVSPPYPQRMTPVPVNPVGSGAPAVNETDHTYVLVAHILMAASLFTVGIVAIAAVVMAYLKQNDVRGTYLESHCKHIIETFWWSIAFAVIGFVLAFIVVGVFVWIAGFVWFVYRVIVGLVRIFERRAI
jgi:uncharacterized membrane protein